MITEEHFIRLFVKHEAELNAFALTLMLQPAEADDLLQEACIAMWRKIDTLENEKAYRSWAYSYLRFTALNRRRKQHRSPLVFSDQLIELMAAEGAEESDLAAAELETLAGCLEKLDGKQRDLVSRYYASRETTVADLGAELGRPVAGIYKALERTRQTLRTCIEGGLRASGFGI
ncbi:MAG: sigma-70 family RNA polymerase sigma factor [Verrucomicrobiales bacterium]|nr:sigma-70 family RNA polymerase sigma factor [Verrucomicrobiales bacterium]